MGQNQLLQWSPKQVRRIKDARAAEPVPAAVPAVAPSLVIQIVTGGNAGEDDGSPQYPVFDGTGARVIRLADVRQRRL